MLSVVGCGSSREPAVSPLPITTPPDVGNDRLAFKILVMRPDSTPVRNAVIHSSPQSVVQKTDHKGEAIIDKNVDTESNYSIVARLPGSDSLGVPLDDKGAPMKVSLLDGFTVLEIVLGPDPRMIKKTKNDTIPSGNENLLRSYIESSDRGSCSGIIGEAVAVCPAILEIENN